MVALSALALWAARCSERQATQPRPRFPFERGVTVGEWGPTAYAPAATKRTFRTLKGPFGVDNVTLFVVWEQKDARSTRIGRPGRAAPRRRIAAAIEAARRAGLRVTLRPYLDRLDGGWRGQIAPSSLDRWFTSYEQFVLEFARVAQAHGVNTFVVGSEMVSISGESARWRRLVKRVRSRFHGTVTYQANWDEADRLTWWDALDVDLDLRLLPPVARPVAIGRRHRGGMEAVSRGRSAPGELGGSGAATAQPLSQAGRVQRDRLPHRQPRDRRALEHRFARLPQPAHAGERVRGRNPRLVSVPWFRGFDWWYVSPQPSLVLGLPGSDHRPVPRRCGC